MANIAQSSFLIKKLIDGKTLSFSLASNSAGAQTVAKDPLTFNPNYTVTPLVYTPVLTVSGTGGTNQIKSACVWFINDLPLSVAANATEFGATVATASPYTLTIRKNLVSVSSLRIRCEYDYVDPITAASTKVVTDASIIKTENTGATVIASVWAPNGDKFTVLGGVIQPLTVKGVMIRGGSDDLTLVSYKWSISTGGAYYPITAATAPAGSGLPTGNLFVNWTASEMTVNSTAVLNVATFKCDITDNDTASSTPNAVVTGYVTLYDATDPYEIIVRQPLGDSITASSTASCVFEVWQGGNALPDTFYVGKTLSFYRHTAAGVADIAWVPSPAFTGWTVAAGIISRAYAAGTGIIANRTITITNGHILANAPVTVFGITLEG